MGWRGFQTRLKRCSVCLETKKFPEIFTLFYFDAQEQILFIKAQDSWEMMLQSLKDADF